MIATLVALLMFQAPKGPLPRFENFHVDERFAGTPARPNLINPRQRLFRTRIREAAQKGPNFAGHYTIAEWGCGTSCVSVAIIDENTGAVYDPPFGIVGYGTDVRYAGRAPDVAGLSYRIDSRLLVIHGCPEDKNCASYYYKWTGSQLKLLLKIAPLDSP